MRISMILIILFMLLESFGYSTITADGVQLLPQFDPRARLMKIKPIPIDLSNPREMSYMCNTIPRKIHQVWVGPRPVPDAFRRWKQYAKRFGYEYKLWRESDILQLPLRNIEEFKSMLGGYAGQSDVARYEIIYKEGGFYIDLDIVPADPNLDIASYLPMTNMIVAPEDNGREMGIGAMFVLNGFFGAAPKHPVLRRVIESLPENFEALKPPHTNGGPMLMTGPFLFNASLFGPFHVVHRDWIWLKNDVDDQKTIRQQFALTRMITNWDKSLSFDGVKTNTKILEAAGDDLDKIKGNNPEKILLWNQKQRKIYFVESKPEALQIEDDAVDDSSLIVPMARVKDTVINHFKFKGRGDVSLGIIGSEPVLLATGLQRCSSNPQCAGVMHISPRTQMERDGQRMAVTYYLGSDHKIDDRPLDDRSAAMIFMKN